MHQKTQRFAFSAAKIRILFIVGACLVVTAFILLQANLSSRINNNNNNKNSKSGKDDWPSSSNDLTPSTLSKNEKQDAGQTVGFVYRNRIPAAKQEEKKDSNTEAPKPRSKRDVWDDFRDDQHPPNNGGGFANKNNRLDGLSPPEKQEDTTTTTKKARDASAPDPRHYFDYEVRLSKNQREKLLGNDQDKLFDRVRDFALACPFETNNQEHQTNNNNNSSEKKTAKNSKKFSQLSLSRFAFESSPKSENAHHDDPSTLDAVFRPPLLLSKLEQTERKKSRDNHHKNKKMFVDLWGSPDRIRYGVTKTHGGDKMLDSSGIYCLGEFTSTSPVADEAGTNKNADNDDGSSFCPASIAIAILPPPKKQNKDASEFGAFPFKLKSVWDIVHENRERLGLFDSSKILHADKNHEDKNNKMKSGLKENNKNDENGGARKVSSSALTTEEEEAIREQNDKNVVHCQANNDDDNHKTLRCWKDETNSALTSRLLFREAKINKDLSSLHQHHQNPPEKHSSHKKNNNNNHNKDIEKEIEEEEEEKKVLRSLHRYHDEDIHHPSHRRNLHRPPSSKNNNSRPLDQNSDNIIISSSTSSREKPFHIDLYFPKFIPETHPILPVFLFEETMKTISSLDEGKSANKSKITNKNKKQHKESVPFIDESLFSVAEPRPSLSISIMNPFGSSTITSLNKTEQDEKSSSSSSSSSSSKDEPELSSFTSSQATGVLINGKGLTKLFLRPKISSIVGGKTKNEEDLDEENRILLAHRKTKYYKGEDDKGILFDAIMNSKNNSAHKSVEKVPLSKFIKISDEESLSRAISAHLVSNKKSKKTEPLFLHITNSIVIEKCELENTKNIENIHDDADSDGALYFFPPGTIAVVDNARTIEFKCKAKNSKANNVISIFGTPEWPIFFTSTKIDQHWGGIIISSPASEMQVEFRNTIISNTGGVRATIKGVGTHIKNACPAIVVRPGASLKLTHNSAIISGKGSGVTSGKDSSVAISDAVLFDLAQGGEFVSSSTKILNTHALHFMLRDQHDEFLDDDNDGFYFRDGTALLKNSVVFGARDDCIDTASSKNKNGNDGRNSSLIILNSVLANCQHEGIALSGSVGIKRNVEIVDTLVQYAQQGIENGHSPSSHVTVMDGVDIEDCGVGLRLGDNYVLDVSGVVDLAGDVEFNRCTLPVFNLLRSDKHRTWQMDGSQQNVQNVRIHPRVSVDGNEHTIGKYQRFCGREMFQLSGDDREWEAKMNGNNNVKQQHEILGML